MANKTTMKAQLIGQVFIYVMTIVLVTFILTYGYKAITTFKDKANQVSYIQFKNNMQNTIETLALDYGSVKVKEFIVPDDITIVSFVNTFPEVPRLSNTGYPIIEDSVNSGVNKNAFLIGNGVEESFDAGKILIDEDLLCIPALTGRIKLNMEGKGDHTAITAG